MPSERLQVILELVTGQYKREAREAASATGELGKSAQTATAPIGNLGKSWTMFKNNVAGPAAIIGAGVAVAGFARDSIAAASDLEESMNAVNVVFGDAADAIHEFGETSVDSVGLAAVNVNKSATVLGSALINVGLDAETAAQKTIELTTRAADMASVFNTTVPEALEAIQSALRGETDPIEKFGVSLSAAAVDAEAAALGYEKVAGQFSTTAKAAARMSLIMQQTDRVAGDFQNTSDSTANTLKKLGERFLEIKARVGQALMPAFSALLGVAEDLAPTFEDFALEIANVVSELAPLIEGLGTVVGAMGDMRAKGDELQESNIGLVASFGRFIDDISFLDILMANYAPHVQDAAEASAELADETKGLPEGFKAARAAAIENQNALETSRNEFDLTTDAMRFMADAAKDDTAPALIRLKDAQRDAETAAKAHRDALIQLTSRLLAQLSPAATAYQALKDLEEAQKAAAEAARLHGEGSREADEAALNLAVSMAAAQAALNAFGDTEGAVRALSDTLGVTADEAARILINLGLITEKDWKASLVIGVRTEGDLRALEMGAIPEGQGIRSPVRTTTLGGGAGYGTGTRAMGGPVRANEMYMVGERGPEMFVSGSSGSILSNDVLKSLSRGNTTINVNHPNTLNLAQDLQLAPLYASVQTMVESSF